jgi:hypothetical protein
MMRFLAAFVALTALLSGSAAQDGPPASDFVTQHLHSIGTEQARAAVNNLVAEGTVTLQILHRGPQTWEGPATLVSEASKLASSMEFPTAFARTEGFVRVDKRTSIARHPGWTELGNFIKVHNEILTEGLWGGTLSTGWALSHLDEHRAKLQDRGITKVGGVELRRIDYIPKKHSDLDIHLYFEPTTFRHVMTVYLMMLTVQSIDPCNNGGTRPPPFCRPESRPVIDAVRNVSYRLEERFGDFKNVDNLTLPTRWILRFAYGAVYTGAIDQYDITETKISSNVTLDPKSFDLK